MRAPATLVVVALSVALPGAQAAPKWKSTAPINDRPNPYRRDANWAQLPAGLKWGAVIGAEPGPDGNVYVVHRCFENSCAGRPEPPILKFDPSGKLLKSWGSGAYIFPHGLHVDDQGSVWVTDAQGSGGIGHQVFKYDRDGRLLLTLGVAGQQGAGGSDSEKLFQPTDVVTGANGDIFVSEGHVIGGPINRVSKWTKDGRFVKAFGKSGHGPGEFDVPHALAVDSRGRLFVADRNNNRIQIFSQDGVFLDEWTQFGRPSGIAITEERHDLRRRLGVVGAGRARVEEGHPRRQREGWIGEVLHRGRRVDDHRSQRGRRRRRRSRRQCVRLGRAPHDAREARAHQIGAP